MIHYQSTLELKTTLIDDEASGDVFVREVGHSLPKPELSVKLSPRDVMTIHFVVSGSCRFCGILTRAGEGCMIPPDLPFTISTGDRLEHYRIMVGGKHLSELLCADEPRHFDASFFDKLRGDFDRIILSGASGGFDTRLYMTSLLYKSAAFICAPSADPADSRSVYLSLARNFIDSNYSSISSVEEIAAAAHISSRYLCKLFVKNLGKSPSEILTERRMECARYLLASTDLPIADVAREVGYSDPCRFALVFRQRHGETPRNWRYIHTRHAEF